MYYRPRLSDGRLAHVAWQIRVLWLNVDWPLEDDSSWMRSILDKLWIIVGFILMSLNNAAELTFIIFNFQKIDVVMEVIAPYIILVEIQLRNYNMALRKKAFKKFLKEFYTKIFIAKDYNDRMYREIQRSMLPTVLYSYTYLLPMLGYVAIPVMGFFKNQLLLPYDTIVLPYDYAQVMFYIPTMIVCLLVFQLIVTCIIGESNLLATIILHLNARYLLLQQDCANLHVSLLRTCRSERILYEFRQGLMRIIERNVELNEFAAKLQAEYSFRVFIMMGMTSIMLCVLAFMVVTHGMSTENISYVTWFAAKVLELTVFGQLGSKLISTTDEISSMYYMSNWEDVILQSTNSFENTQLMKLITLAIEINHKPKYVVGLGYFNVSLVTVLSILQGAFSYFSFLYAIR